MAATILRTPAHNPGLSVLHNSHVLAAYSPIIFEWTRRDYSVNSVSANAGRSNQLDIVVTGDLTSEITGGNEIWLEANGWYSGLATIVSTSYSAPDTTIEVDVTQNSGTSSEADFINLIDDRPNYRVLCDFTGIDESAGTSTGSINTATITPGPGPLFRMNIDAGPFIRGGFDTKATPDWVEGTTRFQTIEEKGFMFYVSYSELWNGGTPSATLTNNFTALPAKKGARDQYGESAINLEVWENSLSEDFKPALQNALPEPILFRGYPFFAGFAYADFDLPTWQLVQNNDLGLLIPDTKTITSINPPGGWNLGTPQDPGNDELVNVQMWIEAGLFWSFWTTYNYGVDIGTFNPTINLSSGTYPNWLFEDGSETTGAPFPAAIDTTGLDGTLQQVQVTGIEADEIQTFAAALGDNSRIAGELSFEPCTLLKSVEVQAEPDLIKVIGPTSSTTNFTSLNIQDCTSLTRIDFRNTGIMSSSIIIADNTALTNINFPTVAAYTFSTFTISGNTALTNRISLGIAFPNLMGVNGCTIDLTGNGWSAADVDYYLQELDEGCPYGFTGRTIDISGNTAPTTASLGARSALAAKAVVVTTD